MGSNCATQESTVVDRNGRRDSPWKALHCLVVLRCRALQSHGLLAHQSSQGHPRADMRLLTLLLAFLMAALTSASPMEIPAKSADYAKYSHLQGPTFYARTEIGPPVPLPQAQSQGW